MLSLRSPERGLKYVKLFLVSTEQMSLRSPERGLKLKLTNGLSILTDVAPFAGAWIEMDKLESILANGVMSLRSPERGLKSRKKLFSFSLPPSLRSPERGLK